VTDPSAQVYLLHLKNCNLTPHLLMQLKEFNRATFTDIDSHNKILTSSWRMPCNHLLFDHERELYPRRLLYLFVNHERLVYDGLSLKRALCGTKAGTLGTAEAEERLKGPRVWWLCLGTSFIARCISPLEARLGLTTADNLG
jgi:hypothetical protein